MAETSDGKQNEQPYKYNGKEFERKNGLNWMDYGARHYDAALGRLRRWVRWRRNIMGGVRMRIAGIIR